MRVAVCLSGQMRSYRECAPALIENIIKPLNADVFIHTWETTGLSTKLMVYVPYWIHHLMPSDIHHDGSDLDPERGKSRLEEVFPTLYNLIKQETAHNQTVDHDELMSLYGARECVVEKATPDLFADRFDLALIKENLTSLGLNAIPMFYKVWACDQLRQKAEEQDGEPYDVVIRIRPDMIVLGRLPEDILLCPDRLTTLHNKTYDTGGITGATFDVLAIGTSEAMSFYASVWERLNSYYDPTQFPDWPLHVRGPEGILYRHLSEIGVEKNTFTPDFDLYRKVSYLDPQGTIDAMLADIGDKPEHHDLAERLRAWTP